jgi:hypothetical protein
MVQAKRMRKMRWKNEMCKVQIFKHETKFEFCGIKPTTRQILLNVGRSEASCSKRVIQKRNTNRYKFFFKHWLISTKYVCYLKCFKSYVQYKFQNKVFYSSFLPRKTTEVHFITTMNI